MCAMSITTTCKDCGEPFTISKAQAKWFTDKGMELPKRCKECRDKRKAQKNKEEK